MIGRPRSSKRFCQYGSRGDEDRDAVDEGAAGLEDLLDVPLGGHLRADRQVVDDHVGLGLSCRMPHDVVGRARRLGDRPA